MKVIRQQLIEDYNIVIEINRTSRYFDYLVILSLSLFGDYILHE